MQIDSYDVVVIGYGPTGATAANLLGRRGLKVAVLERDPDIYGRARAISTDEEVLRIWQGAGLDAELQRDMLPGGVIAFVDATGRVLSEVRPTSRGAGHPPQQFIYQPAVDTTLRRGVERLHTVTVRSGVECLKVVGDSDGVDILAVELATDSFVRLRASYVIAADGGSSSTRGQLGVGYSGTTFTQRWVVIDTKVRREWPGSSRLRFHCNPVRPTVDCPTPLGHHRWEFPVRDGEDENSLVTDAAVWKLLNEQDITDADVEVLRAVVYSHHVRVADRWRVGRVFLAGDAAHAMPPWIGQGMAAGVRDVANLSWKLAAVLDGTLPAAVLDSYQIEREPHVRETTDHAVWVGRIITEQRRWVAALRDSLLRQLSKIAPLRQWSIDAHWIPQAHYPHGFLSEDKHPARGRQIPQPWVLDAGGVRVRLDDVVAGDWAVLTRDAGPLNRPGVATISVLPAGAAPRAGAIVDVDGDLTRWLDAHRAASVMVRPDGFCWAAARPGDHLPAPPVGLAPAPSTTDTRPGLDRKATR